MDPRSLAVVELRQYTLHPGRRDELITLFDREFVETQDAVGAFVLGQFRDLDNPDRFVWLRGFTDMASRARALGAFYGGPVWAANRDAANATMVDSDNVLLLRPFGTGVRLRHAARPDSGDTPGSFVAATIRQAGAPAAEVAPSGHEIGRLVTESAENNFPALPVREGESVQVELAVFDSVADLDRHRDAASGPEVEVLRLVPTARSWLR